MLILFSYLLTFHIVDIWPWLIHFIASFVPGIPPGGLMQALLVIRLTMSRWLTVSALIIISFHFQSLCCRQRLYISYSHVLHLINNGTAASSRLYHLLLSLSHNICRWYDKRLLILAEAVGRTNLWPHGRMQARSASYQVRLHDSGSYIGASPILP